MAESRHHHRHYIVIAFSFLLFASTGSAIITLSQLGSGFEESEGNEKGSGSGVLDRFLAQRRLAGPGSSPPSCMSKCGNCTPCKPALVPIDPGSTMPDEYYPEAWRCMCGDQIFNP